ncbi:MAG TPA: mechanosensitive ion channel family protein [Actinomycetes bacterium]
MPGIVPAFLLAGGSCAEGDGTFCGWVHQVTGQEWVGLAAAWLLATPLTILAILLLAFLARHLVHRVIDRTVAHAIKGESALLRGRTAAVFESSPLAAERRTQRAQAVGSVLRSISTGVILGVAALTVMDVLGIPIGPLLASAGIAGVALGFGAQTLVRDFISGIFMIIEDQYGIGDVIDMGQASGTVEEVGLRVTRLRDAEGTVWHVRNGEVVRVGNRSQGWSRALVDIAVPPDADLDVVRSAMLRVATDVYENEPSFADAITAPPEVLGVESMARDSTVVRLAVTTTPDQRAAVARELRLRIKTELDRLGIAFPATTPATPAPPVRPT